MPGEVSVGDLVVHLTGEAAGLQSLVDQQVRSFGMMQTAVAKTDKQIAVMGQNQGLVNQFKALKIGILEAQGAITSFQAEYMRLRMMYPEANQELIKQVALLKQTATLQSGGMGEEGGGGHGGGLFGGRLGRRHPLMIMARHAGPLLGMGGALGGQMMMFAHLMHGMGAGMAGGLVGVFLVAEAIKGIVEKYEELHKRQKEWNEQLETTREHWQEIGDSVLYTDEVAKTFRSEAVQSSGELKKRQKELEEAVKKEEGASFKGWVEKNEAWMDRASSMRKGGGMTPEKSEEAKTAYGQTIDQMLEELTLFANLEVQLQEVARRRLRRQREIADEDRNAAMQKAAAQAMYEGPARKEVEFQISIEEERRKLLEKQEADRAKFEGALLAKLLATPRNEQDRTVREAGKDRKELLEQQAKDREVLSFQEEQKRVAFERQKEREILQEEGELEDARISAQFEGYAREIQLLEIHFERKKALYLQGGRDIARLEELHRLEKEAKEKNRAEGVEDMMREWQMQAALAMHQITSEMKEWDSLSRSIAKNWGITGEALESMHRVFTQSRTNMQIGALNDMLKQAFQHVLVTRGAITQLEVTYLRLREQFPLAPDDLLRAVATMEELSNKTRFTAGEFESRWRLGDVDTAALGSVDKQIGEATTNWQQMAASLGSIDLKMSQLIQKEGLN